ncbi:class F sortase [Shouchella lehensis]|uniref:Class F sortase n=1 Tax=Shouchella lehensis TaxID=300825 RepID=A0A4Y7WHL4_9BACI|nr:class F sortase [Shouchella lehensis]TES47752.1 class F sortase [Shouchella lehensis]
MQIRPLLVLFLSLLTLIGCSSSAEESSSSQPATQNEIEPPVHLDQEQTIAEEFTIHADKIEEAYHDLNKQSELFPSKLRIPALDVEAPITEVGLLENGQMGVPDNGTDVGWYEPGTKPGGRGNAVLAGHVDDKNGPAVFFYLGDLEENDSIFVTDDNGEELEFTVDRIEKYPYNDAPLTEIFGSTDHKQLNLITCTGTFDRQTGNHDERLVVYTSLVEDTDETPKEPTELTVQGNLLSWYAVRDDYIAGYRVYEVSENGKETLVASISQQERKSFLIEHGNARYTVKTVDYFGNESKQAQEKGDA